MKNNMSQTQANSRQMTMFGPAKMNHEVKLIPFSGPYILQPEYTGLQTSRENVPCTATMLMDQLYSVTKI